MQSVFVSKRELYKMHETINDVENPYVKITQVPKSNTIKLGKSGNKSLAHYSMCCFLSHLPIQLVALHFLYTPFMKTELLAFSAVFCDVNSYSEALVFKYKQMYFHKIPLRLKV